MSALTKVPSDTSQAGYEAFRVHWGLLATKPDCTREEAFRLFMAGAKWREQAPAVRAPVTVLVGADQVRRDIAEELEAAALTETQAARVSLYRQIAARLRGGRA